MLLTRKQSTSVKILYTDLCIVVSTGAVVLLIIELLRPGLVSTVIDISSMGVMALVLAFCGAWFGLYVDSLDRLQEGYLRGSLLLFFILFFVYFSLQLRGHLLGLGVAGIILLLCLISSYQFYDSGRSH
jgi:hypothetical protein